MTSTLVVLLFGAFFLKHFICDFPLQPAYQYKNKGTYGHLGGIVHAGIHAIGTLIVLLAVPKCSRTHATLSLSRRGIVTPWDRQSTLRGTTMTTPVDGLEQFEDWYDTLPIDTIDRLMSLFDATFDAAVAEHQAYSTFPPLVVDKGVGGSI